jgi:hypothetical protein
MGIPLRSVLILLGSLLSACSPSEPAATEVELLVTPAAFVVDGVSLGSAAEAVDAVVKKKPNVLLIPQCGAMETKRVIDVMAGLQGKHNARIVMSMVPVGERGCPKFEAPK